MDRNIGLEAVRLTEAAAIASARLMGRGDEKAADQAAVDAMRRAFNELAIRGQIVIGEGERDEVPMLYIGEKVGCWLDGDPEVDIALDPLEGTTLCATGGPNSLSVIAMADRGNLLNAPDTYMEKIAVGPSAPSPTRRASTSRTSRSSSSTARATRGSSTRCAGRARRSSSSTTATCRRPSPPASPRAAWTC